jgi:hypothetical protein
MLLPALSSRLWPVEAVTHLAAAAVEQSVLPDVEPRLTFRLGSSQQIEPSEAFRRSGSDAAKTPPRVGWGAARRRPFAACSKSSVSNPTQDSKRTVTASAAALKTASATPQAVAANQGLEKGQKVLADDLRSAISEASAKLSGAVEFSVVSDGKVAVIYSIALTMSSTTFLASPKTIMVLSM